MTIPYYSNFPIAPASVVEALVGLIPLPGLFESHVGTDNSLFLDVMFDDENPFTLQLLGDIAAFTGTPDEYVIVEPSEIVEGALSITFAATAFDFTEQFKGTRFENSPHLGVGILDLDEELAVPTIDESVDSIGAALKKFVAQLAAFGEEDDEEEDGFVCTGVHQPGAFKQLPNLSPEVAAHLYDQLPGMSYLGRGPELTPEDTQLIEDALRAGIPDLTPEERAGAVFIDVTNMNAEDAMALVDTILTGLGI